ncbi:MAG: hypothetical protein R2713_14470 [Ilumatobacteraceae bacterium]
MPIFPVVWSARIRIQPPGAPLPKLRESCAIKIGRPIKVERYLDRAGDHRVLRQITDELMFEIRGSPGRSTATCTPGRPPTPSPRPRSPAWRTSAIAIPSPSWPGRCRLTKPLPSLGERS